MSEQTNYTKQYIRCSICDGLIHDEDLVNTGDFKCVGHTGIYLPWFNRNIITKSRDERILEKMKKTMLERNIAFYDKQQDLIIATLKQIMEQEK